MTGSHSRTKKALGESCSGDQRTMSQRSDLAGTGEVRKCGWHGRGPRLRQRDILRGGDSKAWV